MLLELHDRQARILHPRVPGLTVLIAGAGMVGSWTALALVRAVGAVHVWDDDVIEGVNVGVQAYDGTHIGMPKADALSLLATDPPITGHVGRFPDADFELDSPYDTVVVCAVDSMAGRKEIAEWSRDHGIGLFIETGVQAELVVVKTAITPEDYERYLTTLLSGCSTPGTSPT